MATDDLMPGVPAELQFFYADQALQITWDPNSYPADYQVSLEFVNAEGTPLVPQPPLTYMEGRAIVASNAIQSGAQFNVRGRVVPPWSHPSSVVVHDVPAVTNLAIEWRAGELHVSWEALAGGPYGYTGRVLDNTRQPLPSQPAINVEGATGLRIEGAALADHQTYIVAVRASLDQSFGPWAYSPPCQIDKSLPDSPVLRQLKERLLAASTAGSGAFNLTPEVIGEPNVARLFGELLGVAADTLAITGATIASSPSSVTLSGLVAYPWATAASSFLFTVDEANSLRLSLTAENLGSFTVPQLIAAGIIPPSPFDPGQWAAGLAPFPRLSLRLDSATGSLNFGGAPTESFWNVPVGLAHVGFDSVTPDIEIIASAGISPKRFRPQVTTRLRLGADTSIPVFLRLPNANTGWLTGIADGSNVALGDFDRLDPLMGGANSGLPTSFIAIGGFNITALALSFPAVNPQVWKLAAEFSLGPSGDAAWRVVNGLIEIHQLRAQLNLTLYSVNSAWVPSTIGSIGGSLRLANQIAVDVGIHIPADEDGLLLVGSASIDEFNLATLASYLGGSETPLTQFLARIGTVGTLGLRMFSLRFVPDASNPTINSLSVGLELSSWTIPDLAWFSLEQAYLNMDVLHPLDNDARQVAAQAGGRLKLGNLPFDIDIDLSVAERWTLTLSSMAGQLANLDPINPIVSTAAIGQILPTGLDLKAIYDLAGFSLTYNMAQRSVETFDFELISDFDWAWLGGLLTLREIQIDLHGNRAAPSASLDLTGSLAGIVGLVDTEFELRATRPSAGDDWTFSGELADEQSVDFNEILQSLHTGLVLPSGHGFPTAIMLEIAGLRVVPATGQLDLFGRANLDWEFDLGLATFAVTKLGGELHIPAGAGPKTGLIKGGFSLGAIAGFARIALGPGAMDLIVDVGFAAGVRLSAEDVADSVIGARAYADVAAPDAFLRPNSFANAALTVNVTQSSLLLTGQYADAGGGVPATDPRYAALALFIQPKQGVQPQQYGFVVAAALANWRPADLSPLFEGLDAAIGLNLRRAAVALSDIEAAIPEAAAAHLRSFPNGLTAKPGLNFYVELDFDGGLLRNIKSIIGLRGPYTLLGAIPADPGAPITLRAMMGELTLLSVLSFRRLALLYTITPAQGRAPASRELKLSGDIVATLDRDYAFTGDLVVTETGARFRAITANRVANPLGMPALTLDQLGFAVDVGYSGTQPDRTSLAFIGQVSFAAGPTLQGVVALQDGSPVIVFVRLIQAADGQPAQLGISTLFSQVTGLAWPDALDIKLRDGQLWWVPGAQAVSYNGASYEAGFHATVRTTIFFLPEIALEVALYGETNPAQPKGLVAAASFSQPVDWGFIRFTGTQAHGGRNSGPRVSIDTRNDAMPFCLEAGIDLFPAHIEQIAICVGKDRMTGTISVKQSDGFFTDATFAFAWENNQFLVEDWPLQNFRLPDFEFTNVKGSGNCSQLVIESLPIDSTFNLHVGLTITPAQNGTKAMLRLTVSGTFDLVVTSTAYRSDPLLTANIAEARLDIPLPDSGRYDWNALPNAFVDAIKGAAESIFQNLFQDPANLAKLAAVQGIRWSIAEAIDYLVCRGLSRGAATAAVSAATGAGVSTVSTGACGGGAAVAVGGVVGEIVGGVLVVSGGTDPAKPAPAKPAAPILRFNTDVLTIRWDGSSTDNVTLFGVSLVGENDGNVPVPSVPGLSATVPVTGLRLGQNYTAMVIASGPGGRSPASDAGRLYLLDRPARPSLSFDEPILTLSWTGVPGSSGYAAELTDGDGNPLSPAPSLTIQGTTAAVSGAALERGGIVKARIQAVAANVDGSWSDPATLSLAVLPAPAGLMLRMVGPAVAASWQPVAEATGYLIQVSDAANQLLSPQPGINFSSATMALIGGPGIHDDAPIQVRIKAIAHNAVGTYSAPATITVMELSSPAGLALLYEVPTQTVNASWQEVQGATQYALELRDSLGAPLSPQPPISYDGTRATIMAGPDGLRAGETYQAAVRAINAMADSAWSDPFTATLTPLAAPTGLALINSGGAIIANWQAIAGAARYLLELRDADGAPLRPQPPVAYDGLAATVETESEAQPLTPETTYQGVVRAQTDASLGPWSTPVEVVFRILPAPTGLVLRGQSGEIIATWQPVTGATGYQVEVLNQEERPLSPQPPIRYDGTQASISALMLGVGAYQVRVRGLLDSRRGSLSAPAAIRLDTGWARISQDGPSMMVDPVILAHRDFIWAMTGHYKRAVYTSRDAREWQRILDASPPWGVVRIQAAGLIHMGKMWLLGGKTEAGDRSDVLWSDDGIAWTTATNQAPWAARHGLCAAAFLNQIWVFGGRDSRERTYNDVWSSSDGVDWRQVATEIPWKPRHNATAVVFGGRLWMVGGMNSGGGSINEVWSTSDGINWLAAPAPPWPSRYLAVAGVIRDTLYLVGGIQDAQGRQLEDMWATADGNTWMQVENAGPWAPLGLQGLAVRNETLFMLGGLSLVEDSTAVWQYTPPVPTPQVSG